MSEKVSNDLKAPILSCKICSYIKSTTKKNAIGFCKRMNFYLYRNFAPLCLAFTVEQQVRVISPLLDSPPAGKQITKVAFTYNVDKNVETVKAYDNSTELFTLTFSYNADENITSVVRSEP